MNEKKLTEYYNKFNEDKRLTRRHGIVEYVTAMKYLHFYLSKINNPKIIDIGAGTGKYSIALAKEGYDVTAIELVKHNLMTLKKQNSQVKAYQGNALDLKRFSDNSFDLVILFGPMYHLIKEEDKLQALKEAKRIVKPNGYIFISYYMNEYAIIKHGFMEHNIKNAFQNKLIDQNYHILAQEEDLYSMVRIEDIKKYAKLLHLKRVKILAQDDPSDYIRKYLNALDEEEFNIYIDYHLKTCERKELLGASSHILDILQKIN